MTVNSIPQPSHPITPGQRVDPIWYRWLRELDRVSTETGADLSAEIAAIARKLGSPDGSIEGIPESGQTITGLAPIVVNDGLVSLNTLTAEVAGELFGITRDAWGRIAALRPVVAGSGVVIDGTTNPAQISISASGMTHRITTAGDFRRTTQNDLRVTT